MLGLRWFCGQADISALAGDHGVSRATGYRYVDEVIAVLADEAPELPDALARAMADGQRKGQLRTLGTGPAARSARPRQPVPLHFPN